LLSSYEQFTNLLTSHVSLTPPHTKVFIPNSLSLSLFSHSLPSAVIFISIIFQ
jgi:hypothetical protein